MSFESHTIRSRVFLFVVASCATAAASAAEIVFRETAVVDDSIIRLGDVAEIRGDRLATRRRLAALPIMPAPDANQRPTVRVEQIEALLRAAGQPLAEHRLTGARRVSITRRGGTAAQKAEAVRLTPGLVKKVHQDVEAVVREQLDVYAGQSAPWNIEMKLDSKVMQIITLATSPMTVEGGRAPWIGPQQFELRFTTVNGPRAVSIDVNVDLPQKLVIAARELPRGAMLSAADVLLAWPAPDQRAPSAGSGYHRVEDVVGLEVNRPLRGGQVLLRSSVREPIVVRRGDTVAVYSRASGVQVRTFAKASQDGIRGSLVMVEALEDRQKYTARVVQRGVVEVFSQGVSAAAYADRPEAARRR